MPGPFNQNLLLLLKRTNMDRDDFIADFWENPKDTRTPTWWFTRGKTPKGNNLKRLAKYFRSRLGCRLTAEMLNAEPRLFESELDNLLAERNLAVAGLPFAPDKLLEGHWRHLCGTFLLYRRCLVHDKPTFNCDVVTIERKDDDYALAITMYCLPAGNAAHSEDSSVQEQEEFVGQLWKFGNLFVAMTVYSDQSTQERRVHTLHFQWLTSKPKVHHAIIGGFSANLDQPFATRAILIKKDDKDVSTKLRAEALVRPLKADDKAIAQYEHLLSNELHPGHFVLTVDSRVTISN